MHMHKSTLATVKVATPIFAGMARVEQKLKILYILKTFLKIHTVQINSKSSQHLFLLEQQLIKYLSRREDSHYLPLVHIVANKSCNLTGCQRA